MLGHSPPPPSQDFKNTPSTPSWITDVYLKCTKSNIKNCSSNKWKITNKVHIKQQVLEQVSAPLMSTFKNFRIETYIDITIDKFKSLIPDFNPDLESDEEINIAKFYKLMSKSIDLKEKSYTPIYFNLKDNDKNIGGCAIWIMKDYDGRSFAYFYGLHRHPIYLNNERERFKGTSKFLLHCVIEFCKYNNIKFICLPRPCLISTTKLWYSIGMTFLINREEDSQNYLQYLRPENDGPRQPSNLIDFRSILRTSQRSVVKIVEQINLNAEKYGIYNLFMQTDIEKAGILFQDNYDIAMKECSNITINGGKKISTKKKKTIKKKKRYKNKNINKNKNTNKKNNTNKNKKTNKRRRR